MNVRIKKSRPGFSIFRALVFLVIGSLLSAFPVFAFDPGVIAPEALNGHSGEWVILDARPMGKYAEGHLPGAFSFSWENYTRTDDKGIPYRLLPPDQLAAALGRMGIDAKTPVVVCGDADTSWGGEGWGCWVLALLGHTGPVRLLDGGIAAWQEMGFPLETGMRAPAAKPVVYMVRLDSSVTVTAEDLRRNPGKYQVVDTRSLFEWIKRRIPGSTHIEWTQFFTGDDRRMHDSKAVRALLEKNGIDPAKSVVYYCTGGIRSGYAWMAHRLAGFPTAVNFEGGMVEWDH